MCVEMKTCSRCKIEKYHSDFCRRSNAPDGRQYYCKICVSESVRVFVKTPKGRAYQRRNSKVRNKKYPGRSNFYKILRNAIKSGDLVPSPVCEECGSTGRIELHHEDYAHPLDVRALCCQCHNDDHAIGGRGLNIHLLEPDGYYDKGVFI